jgi:uncharacterized protein YceK
MAALLRRIFAALFLLFLALALLTGGCATLRSQAVSRDGIISAIASRNPNLVYVALWTLEQNGMAVPKIEFDKPYSEAEPKLRTLIDRLSRLPSDRQTELDESFRYHLTIYNPLFSPNSSLSDNGWTY